MAESSRIEWTDATVNFWWGCTKVGPGCDHCYAETFDKRIGGAHWGVGAPRRKIKGAVALIRRLERTGRRRVFIQSMSDLFDLEVPAEWFLEAWYEIGIAEGLSIQILTKRITAVEKRLAAVGVTTWPRHAGLMITVVDQAEADRDIPRLLALKARLGIPWVGLSMEPLLGPVDLTQVNRGTTQVGGFNCLESGGDWIGGHYYDMPGLDWVIVGGESGAGARPMHPDWARSLRDQCAAAGVPYFMKQWGEWAPVPARDDLPGRPQMVRAGDIYIERNGRSAAVRHDLSCELEDRPVEVMRRLGKARAGRLLDGREHNGMPGGPTV